MYLRLLEDLKCTEEHCKEYYLKDLLDKISKLNNPFSQ